MEEYSLPRLHQCRRRRLGRVRSPAAGLLRWNTAHIRSQSAAMQLQDHGILHWSCCQSRHYASLGLPRRQNRAAVEPARPPQRQRYGQELLAGSILPHRSCNKIDATGAVSTRCSTLRRRPSGGSMDHCFLLFRLLRQSGADPAVGHGLRYLLRFSDLSPHGYREGGSLPVETARLWAHATADAGSPSPQRQGQGSGS